MFARELLIILATISAFSVALFIINSALVYAEENDTGGIRVSKEIMNPRMMEILNKTSNNMTSGNRTPGNSGPTVK